MTQDMLRQTLATVAYRGNKALRNAPPEFSAFRAAPGSRSAGEILAHMSDLLEWGTSLVKGAQTWQDSKPQAWDTDVERFFSRLAAFDAALASRTDGGSDAQLFQGPIADMLTHIGQIAMLRRLAGSPVRPENYLAAEITVGRVGPEQPAPRKEF